MTEAGWLRPPRLFEPLPLLLCNRGRAFPLANGSIQVCGRRKKTVSAQLSPILSRVAASSPSVFAENRGSTPKGGGGPEPLSLCPYV